MKQSVKNIIRRFVITEKVTKFVIKVFFMSTVSDFKNGDVLTNEDLDETDKGFLKNKNS